MRNPGTDFHRRQLDADTADILARRKVQLRLNAAEWMKRGRVAMAELVNPDNSFEVRADLIAAVMHPHNAPAYQDGAR